MKNLLIYINPEKNFDKEHQMTVKIQIDNSLNLGWKREDILLVTNFNYEYNGVKALVLGDKNYCDFSKTAPKINVICSLFEMGLIKDDLYWFHDFDAFQLFPISEEELEMDDCDFALTDYGYRKKWMTSSIFFKQSSKDIFKLIKEKVYEKRFSNEEDALMEITKEREDINTRIKRLNITYSLNSGYLTRCYPRALKPVRIIHFHPLKNRQNGMLINPIDFFMYGKNELNIVLMTPNLTELFKKHGIV